MRNKGLGEQLRAGNEIRCGHQRKKFLFVKRKAEEGQQDIYQGEVEVR